MCIKMPQGFREKGIMSLCTVAAAYLHEAKVCISYIHILGCIALRNQACLGIRTHITYMCCRDGVNGDEMLN